MKRKDITALHSKTMAELLKMQQELGLQLAKARMEKKASKLENVSSVKTLADDLARVKTVARLKTLTEKTTEKTTEKAAPAAKEDK